ncbi:hypothetical protein PENTCL1PPCAC_14503 [Pristionchus entomophagus]|uniref:G-protein coupled receptors family 1 profile domain-containing protein n=1 Tax=Pristionchus entomophagus TaxID=358040 RepID=A0AAV5TAT5_9BILA|nr:hypothetical protein PENTCL1PPCAC_14503 [Pristionchus entomophagus]
MVDTDQISCELVVMRKKTSLMSFSDVVSHLRRSSRRLSSMPLHGATAQPMWRRRIRGKLFRSTLLIVAAHFLFWFPYNFAAVVTYVNIDYKEFIAMHVYFLNDLQILITIVNPMLYAMMK